MIKKLTGRENLVKAFRNVIDAKIYTPNIFILLYIIKDSVDDEEMIANIPVTPCANVT